MDAKANKVNNDVVLKTLKFYNANIKYCKRIHR